MEDVEEETCRVYCQRRHRLPVWSRYMRQVARGVEQRAQRRCYPLQQHTSAYVSIRRARRRAQRAQRRCYALQEHTSAYVSIRQHTSREA